MHVPGSPDAASLLSVRASVDYDRRELARLAELDSAEPLRGRVLVGRIDGVLRAALSLDEDRVIADPFAPTRALVALLRQRARTLRTS
jgi:hypothetical protein